MATQSRSPMDYLKRKGVLPTTRPGPRFSPFTFLVQKYPTGETVEKAEYADGAPPTDRAGFHEWPYREGD